MASFELAYGRTVLTNEGGYSCRKNDPGGETYRGISRRHHPRWTGWPLVDDRREEPDFPFNLEGFGFLRDMVKLFYLDGFWYSIAGDDIAGQGIAEEVFDAAVNTGVRTAVRSLQEALNFLNGDGASGEDLVEDGRIGPKTLRALDERMKAGDDKYVLKILLLLRGNRYLELMRKSRTQEVFARGWLKRIDFARAT